MKLIRSNQLPRILIIVIVAFAAFDLAYHYPRLPPQVAAHFDAQGRPDRWSTKGQFVIAASGGYLFSILVLGLVAILVRLAPRWTINLPHREYWLAPQRESSTRQTIARWTEWFTAATLSFLAVVFHDVMAANLRPPPRLQVTWYALVAYLAIALGLVLAIWVRFRRRC